MTSPNTPLHSEACSLSKKTSATELQEIHKASVARHASILAETRQDATAKMIQYFQDLQTFLERNQFQGCPYTNALFASYGTNAEIVQQVINHKKFIRNFLITLSAEITTPCRAELTGEHLFLLYSGATTECQNLRDTWPVERALEMVQQILQTELALKESAHPSR